jgi:ferredoxin
MWKELHERIPISVMLNMLESPQPAARSAARVGDCRRDRPLEEPMRVLIDKEKCVASGQCVLIAPEVFAQDEDSLVVVLQEQPPPELHDKVRAAVRACPSAAIWTEP